jgi:alkylation response protein AidB-like acyl-CoA dehydrogenase
MICPPHQSRRREWGSADQMASGRWASKKISITTLASEAGWHAAEATMQTYGGFGWAREYDIERKWREGRLYQTAPISTNLILAYIGQHVLGMPRSY